MNFKSKQVELPCTSTSCANAVKTLLTRDEFPVLHADRTREFEWLAEKSVELELRLLA